MERYKKLLSEEVYEDFDRKDDTEETMEGETPVEEAKEVDKGDGERISEVRIEFSTGNAAFEDWEQEVKFVLDACKKKIFDISKDGSKSFSGKDEEKLRDSNGNSIGVVVLK